MKKVACGLSVCLVAIAIVPAVCAQAPKATDFPAPKPAFPGQTNAPAPQKASPRRHDQQNAHGG